MAHQDVRYYLNGLLFDIAGPVLTAVATDGHRLAKSQVNMSVPEAEARQAIVPRKAVLELAEEAGHDTKTTAMGLHDLYNADECFLTGTGAEIVPVIEVDGRQVGDGKPGTVTRRLMAMYRELRVKDGTRVNFDAQPAPAT